MTDSFAGLPRPRSFFQKWSCALGREVSIATTFRRLREMASVATNLQQNPCLTAGVEAASVDKHAQRHTKTGRLNNAQKSFFSDQSKLCIEFGDRGALVWRTKNKRYNPVCLKRSVKLPTSVMVWGCVSTGGMDNIVFLKSTVTLHHTVYMEVLQSHLLSIEDLYGICMAMKTWFFSNTWLLHTPRKRLRHGYRSGAFKCSIG